MDIPRRWRRRTTCIKVSENVCFRELIPAVATGEEEELADGTQPTVDPLTFPQFIVSMELSDDTIKERVMALPEAEVAGTRNSEEGTHYR